MVFSSATFLFAFLPLVTGAYYLCKNRVYRNAVLLLASLLFYSWGEPRLLLLLIAATAAAYVGGLAIDRGRCRRLALTVTVVLLVGNLFVFKYLNFFADSLFPGNLLPRLTLPIGISFYTFQILSYVIDLYRGSIRVQRNFFRLLLYVSFFPQLIAGPIVRYQTVESEIRDRRECIEDVAAGLRRFTLGLAKKVILANRIALLAETVYAGDAAVYGTALYWLAAVAYALQIYFDFSGYSDMAIGMGRMFGFHFLENFDHPYCALSVTDFWRRWHISLSSWFRDYIYIPLGGNRVRRSRWVLNLLLVWALTGFWHGAQWNFLLWGLYYGLLLLVEKCLLGRVLDRLPKAVRWVYTAFFVLIGWVLFDLVDFGALRHALGMMFLPHATDWAAAVAADASLLKALLYLPLGAVCCLPLLRRPCRTARGVLLANAATLALFAVCVVYILSSSYNPFIYFRF